MAIQIDIFGNDVQPKSNKNKYEVHYERNNSHSYETVEAVSEKQAIFFIKQKFNFKCKILDVYKY